MPVPTPAPASSLPSLPTPTAVPSLSTPSAAPAQQPPVPAQQQQPAPHSPDTGQAPASASQTTQQPGTSAPAYQDPLQQPIPTPSAGQAPTMPVPVPAQPSSLASLPAYDPGIERASEDSFGSTYIPVDSPVYAMALRLYSMGYLDTAFISMRPWTRRSLLHMLAAADTSITSSDNDEAIDILAKLKDYLAPEESADFSNGGNAVLESVYTRVSGISGLTLRDSYHLGQTFVNDYGRPYAAGFNNITGLSARAQWWRFSLYVRGEFQHAPGWDGYSYAMANQLSCTDLITPCPMPANFYQDTLPYGNTGAQNPLRLQEAALSFHVLGHEISGGKTDAWMGPGYGGAMAWSNNAENIYSFRINRIEPLHIPLVSKLLGPFRYDFFVGSLKGHTVPHEPWVHAEMFSFRPSSNVEISFERTVIWGGAGHEPINLHTFLKSFFSLGDTTPGEKYSVNDPGARFSDFSFSWRLPFFRHYLTLYTDSIAHDDVSPISAPRRAAYRPGLYLSQFPGMPKLDLRVEAVSTDTSTLRSLDGQFNYYEIVQLQGYTNKGFIMGDWIGREAKGGQAWLTYHLSADEWVQLEYLNKKTPKDFIPGGTTQNQFKVDVLKKLGHNLSLDAWLQYERWKAPVFTIANANPLNVVGPALYHPDAQSDTTVAAQITWYPKLHKSTALNGK